MTRWTGSVGTTRELTFACSRAVRGGDEWLAPALIAAVDSAVIVAADTGGSRQR